MTDWRAALRACALALLLAGSVAARADDAWAQHFEQAGYQVLPYEAVSAGPPAPDAGWQPVSLPHVERRGPRPPDGVERAHTMHWYLLRWTVPAGLPAKTPLVVYVPRVLAEPARLWRLGSQGWQPVFDNTPGELEQWNRPLFINLPPLTLAPGETLTLALGTPALQGRVHAVSSVWVGSEAELRERHALRSALQQAVPAAASLAMLALGLLSFFVWLGRRGERGYLYFALAAIGWTLRNLHLFMNHPADDVALDWFCWMSVASIWWQMLATYLFAFRFDARRLPRFERGLVAFVLVGSVLTMPDVWPASMALQHGTNLVAALTITAVLTALAVRGGSRELCVIVVALWVCFAFGVQDWMLLEARTSPETIFLLPYGSLLLVGSFLYAALRRFTGAVEQASSASRVLAARLAEREAELAAQHEQLRAVEREQALLLERQRLMRDMHDGVGSHLIALLRLADSGASGEAMADLLRSAIEDLRLTIDSLEPLEHDLATLLATLRTRVGRRLEGAGLTLEWHMADMPPLPWLEPALALQVLRLIQEAMTNVIKHAQARTLSLSARQEGEALEVRIEDDGCGFDATCPPAGQGLASMKLRAQALDAALQWHSAPGQGTQVSLRLPLRGGPAAASETGLV